jgi:hypothetical protein
MNVSNKKTIIEEVKHHVIEIKNHAEFIIKDKYLDLKYGLYNAKQAIKLKLGYEPNGIVETFSHASTHFIDKGKVVSDFLEKSLKEEYRHSIETSNLVEEIKSNDDEL